MAAAVALFLPCFVDQLWPQAGQAAVELIEACGRRVVVAEAVCCGQVLANAGEAEEARRVREFWQGAHADSEEVVVLSASCASHLARTAEPEAGPSVREFCEWFVERSPLRFPAPVGRRIALQASCSAMRDTATADAMRDLLARVSGLQVFEPVHAEECCGFGGSFAASFADLSVRMGVDKVQHLMAAGDGAIDAIVSADCSCLIHLSGVAPQGAPPVFHVAEILREALK